MVGGDEAGVVEPPVWTCVWPPVTGDDLSMMFDAPLLLQVLAWAGVVWAGVGIAAGLVLAGVVALQAFRDWMGRVPEGWDGAWVVERDDVVNTAIDVDVGSLMKVLADDGDRLRDEGEERPGLRFVSEPSDWQTDPGPGATP